MLHNGTEMENKEEEQDSEKLSSASATVVTKVQNGGVARHANGQCDLILHEVFKRCGAALVGK